MKKRKLMELCGALLCAICLWVYVVTVVTPDGDVIIEDIPITFAGENILRNENNLILTNRSARTVSVTFHGSRVLLKQLEEEKSSITAVLDVSMFTSERDYSSGYDVIFPASLQDGRIQMVECTPKTVQFTVERLASKNVNVKGLYDGTLATDHVIGDLVYNQDVIKVSGPADLVEQVSHAQVLVGGKDLRRTTTKEVPVTLIDKNGEPLRSADLALSATDIQVTVPVYLRKELDIVVTPIYGAAATPDNTEIMVAPSSVTVLGDSEVLADMKELNLGTLDLSSVLSEDTIEYKIPAPSGVLLPDDTTKALVHVAFEGLQMTPFEVHTVEFANVNENLEAFWEDPGIVVTLRGPTAHLETLSESSVHIKADLSGYRDPGLFTVPVSVTVDSESVVCIGEYSAIVNLQYPESVEPEPREPDME